jgi:selenoprotein W-related protein
LAADLENVLQESSKLIQSSGGVFEVEYKDQLIYSKKATGRFPEDGEVLQIVKGVESGLPLAEAQAEAAKNAPHHPSFTEWLKGFLGRKKRA